MQAAGATWNYHEAFSRNLGLINNEEQDKLRQSRVAIAGMGGVGGLHLTTLTRLGVGRFTIADGDTFSVVNTNRQAGCFTYSLGHNKALIMAEQAKTINPEIDVKAITKNIETDDLDNFFEGADIFIDGIDFFNIDARRLIFREAQKRGLWAVTAGPLGFGTAWLCFDPNGMTFDEYFDLKDDMSQLDKLIAFFVGLAPSGVQGSYISINSANAQEQYGPSLGLACQLCAGVAATEVTRILLGREKPKAAPVYNQFDPYVGKLVNATLWMGNRHPLQRLLRWMLRKSLDKQLAKK